MMNWILVTGGCGFIGGNFVLTAVGAGWKILTLDALTYAASPRTLECLRGRPNHRFVKGSIADAALVQSLLHEIKPRAVINFAAATHVDRSIDDPKPFLESNVTGVFTLLECCRSYLRSQGTPGGFRLLHVSTDEIYGSAEHGESFAERSPHRPSSPYAASKAAADDMVHAWHCTYGLPTLTTNCTNNYGPYQFPEKLIPHMILRALSKLSLPIYGDGRQRRDWLHVSDHVRALMAVIEHGTPGQTFNITGRSEVENIAIVHLICDRLDQVLPREDKRSYSDQITFVADRPGHDRRYSLDDSKLESVFGFTPSIGIERGIRDTVDWYLSNGWWWRDLIGEQYNLDRAGLGVSA